MGVAVPAALALILGLVVLVDVEPTLAGAVPGERAPGFGVGFTICDPLGSVANANLRPTRFAMGNAFNATCRQIGAAPRHRRQVALLGPPGGPDLIESFDRAWLLIAGTALLCDLLIFALYRRPSEAPEPEVPLLPALAAD